MLLAAIDAAHGQRLVAARDPDTRLAIAHDGIARSPLPAVRLQDPQAAQLLVLFLCATDPALVAALTGHPLIGAEDALPLRAVAPTAAHRFALQLEKIAPLDLDRYLQIDAAEPPPDAATCQSVRDLFSGLKTLYRAAADQQWGVVALPE